MGLLHRSALSCPLALAAALVTGGLGAGCFVADAPPETIVACSDVDACPPCFRDHFALRSAVGLDKALSAKHCELLAECRLGLRVGGQLRS
jgi:hypothetical protein